MADETNIETKAETVVDANAAPVEAVAAKVEKAVAKPAAAVKAVVAKPVAKAKRAVAKRSARKAPVRVAAAVTKTNQRVAKSARKATKATAAVAATQIERTTEMTYDFNKLFAGFQFPTADKFQTLFADAGAKGQEYAAKGQKAAEEVTELAKANFEAIAEAGRIAASGAKSIGQDAIASSKEGLELASQNVKTLAGATSPTEFVQLQSELARASFDRFVTETSKWTEQVVKLAGEAIQPISNRASRNAERINELLA